MTRLHTSNIVASVHHDAAHARNIAVANAIGGAAARVWLLGESLVHAALVGAKTFNYTLRSDYKRGVKLASNHA